MVEEDLNPSRLTCERLIIAMLTLRGMTTREFKYPDLNSVRDDIALVHAMYSLEEQSEDDLFLLIQKNLMEIGHPYKGFILIL